MSKENIKQVIISICIGAGVAFFTALFDGLSAFLKQYAPQVASGILSATVYLAKAYKG